MKTHTLYQLIDHLTELLVLERNLAQSIHTLSSADCPERETLCSVQDQVIREYEAIRTSYKSVHETG